MDKFKSKSPRNQQLPTIMVKSSNSSLNTIENDDDVNRNFDFYRVFHPLYIFSHLFGLMPFSIVRNSNGDNLTAKVTVRDLMWFFSAIIWYFLLAAIATKNLRLPQDPNESLTINVGDHLLLITGLTLGIFSIMMDMFNRNKLVKIVHNFNIVDSELAKYGTHMDNKHCHRRLLVFLLIAISASILATWLAFMTYGSIRNSHSKISMIHFFCAYTFQTVLMSITLTTFIAFMMSLHRRFDALNLILRKHFLNDDIKRVPATLNKEISIATIKFVGRQYSFLTDMMDQINNCYAFQIMICSGTCFVLSVLTFYSFYRFLLQQNEFFEESSKVHLNRCLFFTSYITVVIYQGSSTENQGKKMSKLVHNIINACYDTEIVQTLDQLSNQIAHQYPVATCGMFAFDWQLLFIMIGSSATYLTILVQFEP